MIRYRYPATYDVPCDQVSDEEMLFVRIARYSSESTKINYCAELRNNLRRFSQILESAGHFPDCYLEPSLSFWYLRRPAWNGCPGLCRNLHHAAEMFYYLRTRIEDMQQLRDRYDHLWNLVLDAIDETAH